MEANFRLRVSASSFGQRLPLLVFITLIFSAQDATQVSASNDHRHAGIKFAKPNNENN